MKAAEADDPTVRLPPPVRRRWRWLAVGLALVVLAAGGFLAWRMLRPAGPPILRAGEAVIDANHRPGLTVFRFAPDPAILVLDFTDLEQQGLMLDRVAAFVEKAGLPKDRLLNTADLDAAIRAGGDTVATYYYGHDYSAADLARFFALAKLEAIHLDAQEIWLRRLLRRLGWLRPGAVGALLSIPRVGPGIDAKARATILHHELSHGFYFTDAGYRRFVAHFWHATLTPAERAGFRRFLGSEGYDTHIPLLMMNETQAYLMFTPDPRFFRAAVAGLSEAEAVRLRASFRAGMPKGWLEQTLAHPPAVLASK